MVIETHAVVQSYRPQSEEDSVEADRVVFALLREKSICDRISMTAALNRGARELSLVGLKRTFNHLNPTAFAHKVAFIWLGHQWPTGLITTGVPMDWVQDSLQLAQQLHSIFAQNGVAYYITGEVAATAYGDPRTTRDLDVVLNLKGPETGALITTLERSGFYVAGIDDVLTGRINTLQIIDQKTVLQADLILAGTASEITTWEAIKFERRRLEAGLYFITPEDIVLSKLRWRQQSQSEKQWRDILGILKVQGDYLDVTYLKKWSKQLGLSRDLEQAFGQAGLEA